MDKVGQDVINGNSKSIRTGGRKNMPIRDLNTDQENRKKS